MHVARNWTPLIVNQLLMVPKPDRLLLSETQMSPSDGVTAREVSVKQKNLRRFSDMMKGSNENLELWVVYVTCTILEDMS